ncbi:MAG: DUF1194 domain-containing protein [Pseudomonadota bacterium]
MLIFTAGHVQAQCRQALALGLDVSGSVDVQEYRLQLDGLAAALSDPEVQAAFFAIDGLPVRLMVYEWSGMWDQSIIVPWTNITGPDQLLTVASTLQRDRKRRAKDGSTAIAAAMRFGAAELMAQADCWQKTLDISGDGPANFGEHPKAVRSEDIGFITINGLVVLPHGRANTTKNLTNVKTLETYYRSFVLRGPGAFIEPASAYSDFSRAMRQKLIKELQLPNLSDLGNMHRSQ